MGNLCAACQPDPDVEAGANPQPSRYGALLGPMLGGSFPASVAVYSLVKESSDFIKLSVFGGITIGVFVIASGLAATSLGTTPKTVVYARFATLLAVSIVLTLFTVALCVSFTSAGYKLGCGLAFGALICILDAVWIFLKW